METMIVSIKHMEEKTPCTFGSAYLQECAERIAAQALKTKYDKSANQHILDMRNTNAYYQQRKASNTYREGVTTTATGENLPLMELVTVTHEREKISWYEMETMTFERGRKISARTGEIKFTEVYTKDVPIEKSEYILKELEHPYSELRLTKAGREWMEEPEEDGAEPCFKFEDVVNWAWIVIAELLQRGLITDYSHVWEHRHNIYRRINTEIERLMNHYRKNDSLEALVYGEQEEPEEEKTVDMVDESAQRPLLDVEALAYLDMIKPLAFKHMGAKLAKEKAWTALTMRLHGAKNQEIANALDVKLTQVDRWLKASRKAVYMVYYCNNPFNDKRATFKIAK